MFDFSNVTGLPPHEALGLHGTHIHEFGDTRDSCLSTGAHYNPLGSNRHGDLESENPKETLLDRHMGDLGNLMLIENVPQPITQSELNIYGPEFNILGRAIVIHEKPDDLGLGGNAESLATGNSGARIACGIIVSTTPPQPTPTPTAKK